MKREPIAATGISCNGCEQNVEYARQTIEGVTRVEGDTVEDGVADIEAAIERAGYDVAA